MVVSNWSWSTMSWASVTASSSTGMSAVATHGDVVLNLFDFFGRCDGDIVHHAGHARYRQNHIGQSLLTLWADYGAGHRDHTLGGFHVQT